VLNWFFAAAPGHPVLRGVCDHIARNALSSFSNNTIRDTSERTGAAVWTDMVLRHAASHPAGGKVGGGDGRGRRWGGGGGATPHQGRVGPGPAGRAGRGPRAGRLHCQLAGRQATTR